MPGWGHLAKLATIAAFFVAATTAAPARADSLPRLIPRLIEESGWLHRRNPTMQPDKPALHVEPMLAPQWLPSSLHVSVLARDWREAYSITDGHPLVFDRMRMIRSSRMAVTRISAIHGRFLPFAEISAGQWRVDSEWMPILPRETELATQLAVGFELQVAKRCAFAWDIERTGIYREKMDAQSIPVSSIVGTFAALRAEF